MVLQIDFNKLMEESKLVEEVEPKRGSKPQAHGYKRGGKTIEDEIANSPERKAVNEEAERIAEELLREEGWELPSGPEELLGTAKKRIYATPELALKKVDSADLVLCDTHNTVWLMNRMQELLVSGYSRTQIAIICNEELVQKGILPFDATFYREKIEKIEDINVQKLKQKKEKLAAIQYARFEHAIKKSLEKDDMWVYLRAIESESKLLGLEAPKKSEVEVKVTERELTEERRQKAKEFFDQLENIIEAESDLVEDGPRMLTEDDV